MYSPPCSRTPATATKSPATCADEGKPWVQKRISCFVITMFSPRTTEQALSKRQTPILQAMGDAQATRSNIAQAASLALGGDDAAAIAISEVTRNPLLALKRPRKADEQQRKELIPDGLPDDALHWLRLAADRGDSLAQLRFVNTLMTTARLGLGPHHIVDTAGLIVEDQRGLRYLDALISAGVADSLTCLAAAYNEGLLGLAQDAAKAHAALLVLQTSLDTKETRQRLDWSRASLRAGEIDRANALVASGQWRPAFSF